jgi:hypothetical protein
MDHSSTAQSPAIERTTSLLDTTSLEEIDSFSSTTSSSIIPKTATTTTTATRIIHPFATALTERGLIRSRADEKAITSTLQQFTDRTRQWESTSSFRLDTAADQKFRLIPHFDPHDLPPDMADVMIQDNNNNNNQN